MLQIKTYMEPALGVHGLPLGVPQNLLSAGVLFLLLTCNLPSRYVPQYAIIIAIDIARTQEPLHIHL